MSSQTPGVPPGPASAPAEATPSAALPDDALAIVPVRNMVLFPGVVLPVMIGRPESVAAAQYAVRAGRPLGLLLQKDPATEEPQSTDLHEVGTVATILRFVTTPDGQHHLVCSGEARFQVVDYLPNPGFLAARVRVLQAAEPTGVAIEARFRYLQDRAVEALQLTPQVPAELVTAVGNITSPTALGDLVASFLEVEPAEKQALLANLDLAARLDMLIGLLARRIEVLKVRREIESQTAASLTNRQREAVLREQLRQIQKELGEESGSDASAGEVAELEASIAAAGMPAEVEEQARRELKRIARMGEAGAEYSMQRSYLDWLVALPWSKLDPENIDIAHAREVLDAEHYGLDRIKRRVLEYLAVRKLTPTGHSPILCFVGPPGVGKTSLGQSIARALGLQFVRASLGGVHDEAEIRGHRRTYVGALPGNIIQGLRKAGTRNPVFMLDEVDKLSTSLHGDPSAALLEVLDPEQNSSFRDNYLGLPFDLSRVMFVTTANVLDTIHGPLRDRMEVIELSGYTDEEKIEIARRHLLPRQLKANGLSAEQASITTPALQRLVRDYTREAGCRNLDRQIATVLRHAAVRIAEGKASQVAIDVGDLAEALGPARFEDEVALRTAVPGVATGLAWTPVGGDILFIESTRMPGDGKLILTGQLGDVMKESAQAALSLIKAGAAALGVSAAELAQSDLHIHLPAGAIPKDGPSAGIALYVSLLSLLTGRAVRPDVAMTGEISLRGLALPVGGIKEKVMAAARAGIRTVILPKRNEKDLVDVPDSVRARLQFVVVDHVDAAAAAALSDTRVSERSAA
jgi:ATP-dependent Lon protease